MNGSIDEYMKARRSGGYIHPESKKIYEEEKIPLDLDPNDPWAPAKPFKLNWKKTGIILLILMLIFIGWKKAKDNPEIIEQVKNTITEQIEDVNLFTTTKEILVESSPIPQYADAQLVALEKIKAWERITAAAIEKFYATPVQSGYKRTLCIVVDGDTSCRSVSDKGALQLKQP